jgi:hypothetical protein
MKLTIWKCLTSSNWWWYGDVNPEVLPSPENRPKFWRPEMIFGVFLITILLTYPTIASILNYWIPMDSDLVTLRGQVVGVSKKSPHIQLVLNNGETVNADFPVISVFGPTESRKFFDYEQRDLVWKCKDVEVTGQYLLHIPIQRFRIWEFKCSDYSFIAKREAIRNNWRKSRIGLWKFLVPLNIIAYFLIVGSLFIRERKDHGIKG